MKTEKMSRVAGSRRAGKKRLFKQKSNKPSLRHRKTTVRIVAFAVVFIFLSPFLLVPNTAHAFSFGDLAGNILGGAFGGGKSYVGGSVSSYLNGKLGSGFGKIVDQKIYLQSLYGPAMKGVIEEMDDKWMPGVPGFFTVSIYYPQKALEAFVGSGSDEQDSYQFQQSGNYAGLVENAEDVVAFQKSQSEAQAIIQSEEQKISDQTGANALPEDSEINEDIQATKAAFESTAVTGLMEGGGGFWGSLLGGIAGLFL